MFLQEGNTANSSAECFTPMHQAQATDRRTWKPLVLLESNNFVPLLKLGRIPMGILSLEYSY